MSPIALRVLGIASIVLLLAALAATSSAASPVDASPSVPLQATPEPMEGLLPCDPIVSRTIEPNIFKVGEQATVRTDFRYNCTGKTRQINYFIVFENSTMLRVGEGLREALDNVAQGAARFVNQVDYGNGSMGGLILYASSRTVRLPLSGGDSGQEAMITALGNISIASLGGGAIIGEAIMNAVELLPTNVASNTGANIMIVIDSGGMEIPSPLVSRATACGAARAAGITTAVISFPRAQRRLQTCATRGWYREVNSDQGRNVPQIFDDFAEGMLRGKQMQQVTYTDFLEDGFEYVSASGYPRDPDVVPPAEYYWQFSKSVTTQHIEYKIKATDDLYLTGVARKMSVSAEMKYEYADSTSNTQNLPNPDICVYRADPSECANKIPTPTSSAPPPTAVPTTPPPTETPVVPTDTPDVPTATPDVPTDTPDVPTDTPETPDTPTPVPTTAVPPTTTPGVRIFMPVAYAKVSPAGR